MRWYSFRKVGSEAFPYTAREIEDLLHVAGVSLHSTEEMYYVEVEKPLSKRQIGKIVGALQKKLTPGAYVGQGG